MRYSRFLIAASVPCFSAESASVEMRFHHVELSSAKVSQELTLLEKTFSEAFKMSVKRFSGHLPNISHGQILRKEVALQCGCLASRGPVDLACPSDLWLAH